MRLRLFGAALLTAAALAPAAPAQERPAAVPLVRIQDGHRSDLLFRVHPRTLRRIGRPIRTFRSGAWLAMSPDGRTLAYTGGWRGRSRIHFVDLVHWRSLGVSSFGKGGAVATGWASPDRLLAVQDQGARRQRLLLIDARRRKVLARHAFSGWALRWLATPGGQAIALAPVKGIGPLRILLADGSGGFRTIRLDGIPAGGEDREPSGLDLTPAVTVDPDGVHLYAVAARGLLVADLELATGAVSYHPLGASAAKGNVDVWWRDAAWAGDGRIALTGEHFPAARGRRPPRGPMPLGLRMIDTRDWSIATLDPRPSVMSVAGDTVLAYGTRWFTGRRPPESTGLLAFDRDGRRRFTRFRGQDVAGAGSQGGLAYVWLRRARMMHVIDLRDGRTLNRVHTGRRPPFLLTQSALR
jgi:hypothetical protein